MSEKANPIKPKFDFSGIDTANIDPDRLQLGIGQQDCALIAQTFERGAHSTLSEAAVFSTLTRGIQGKKHFSIAASSSLKTYLNSPEEAASRVNEQANAFASGAGGVSSQNDHVMQAFNIGTQEQSTQGDSFGSKLMNWAKDCVPCSLRLMSFLELHPNVDLIEVLEGYLEGVFSQLIEVASMLSNFDIYGDFCALLDFLSFMCIPDLQKIITLLMSLFMLEVPKLDGLIGLLQVLIVPIFAPILMSITTLLDQFSTLVTGPLDCVVDALNSQLEKISLEVRQEGFRVESVPVNGLEDLSGGIKQLNLQVQDGIKEIRRKLNFYITQTKSMLGEVSGGDSAYLKSKLQVLQLVRMVSFVVAIIKAIDKGHSVCSSDKTPEVQELDNFFNNFLNPNSPFNMWVDNDGQIHIDEKVKGFDVVADSPGDLLEAENMLQFEGISLLDVPSRDQIAEISSSLTESTHVVVPCRLETSVSNADKVNQWISELNKS